MLFGLREFLDGPPPSAGTARPAGGRRDVEDCSRPFG